MPQCATWFVRITCQNDQQAVLLAKWFKEVGWWCGLWFSHGPEHIHNNALIAMAYDGCLDGRKLPFYVAKVEEFRILGKFYSKHFEWPDQPDHSHLRDAIVFKRRQ